ncbi:MAG: polyprenyl synthetase family protein [Spirochaetia bacterium]|nr:polyprenyl synthetase family protein [Spirochaetia bacterium]
MKEFFAQQKQIINHYLSEFLTAKSAELNRVHSMGGESGFKIQDFAGKGKMLRGGLVALAYFLTAAESAATESAAAESDATAGTETQEKPEHPEKTAPTFEFLVPPRAVSAVGGVMELFQSAFLIHDDIMDRDEMRRGSKSVYAQYVSLAEKEEFTNAYHTGESMGICVGDIAFFLAFEILAEVSRSTGNAQISELCSRELSYVGVAQMLDVYWGQTKAPITEEEVFDLYRYKTGRYTFSLPLLCGGHLAGARQAQLDDLERIGELLGIVFQLKDDELGLFGEEAQLGKPIGSDISEGKKTLFYVALMDRAEPQEKVRLESVFGKKNLSFEEVEYVRGIVRKHGIREWVLDVCRRYAEEARELIDGMEQVSEPYRQILIDLLDYSLNRVN